MNQRVRLLLLYILLGWRFRIGPSKKLKRAGNKRRAINEKLSRVLVGI